MQISIRPGNTREVVHDAKSPNYAIIELKVHVEITSYSSVDAPHYAGVDEHDGVR